MTVETTRFAQSLTDRLMKGMLTGPVTMLQWSFVRNDQPRSTTALQLALAIREEVSDLEKAGIQIIQIDEPAFREGLPLRRRDWDAYLQWAVKVFKISAACVRDETRFTPTCAIRNSYSARHLAWGRSVRKHPQQSPQAAAQC